jgi:hypothetical protein
MITLPYTKAAEVALALMAKAAVQADDESLALVMGVRRMLKAIATGELIVTEPPTPRPIEPQWNHVSSCPAAAGMGPCNCGSPAPPGPSLDEEGDDDI